MDCCSALTTILMVTAAMMVYNNARSRHRLTRSGLLNPLNEDTAWSKLLRDADDGSFLNIVSLDRLAFYELVRRLYADDHIDRFRRGRGGRRAHLSPADKVGLYMVYVTSTMRQKDLALMFGILPSTICTHVLAVRRLVVEKLPHYHDCAVRFPKTTEEKERYGREFLLFSDERGILLLLRAAEACSKSCTPAVP